MSDVMYAAFGALAVLVLVNSVVLVATRRQVGVLHQRLAPTGAGDLGGPEIGARVPRLTFQPVGEGGPGSMLDARINMMVFVSPGCGVCSEVIPGAQSLARTHASDELEVVLVTDAGTEAATAYRREHKVQIPFLRHDEAMRELRIPAAPYALALRPDGDNYSRVLASGVINTTEQLDSVLDLALSNAAAFDAQLGINVIAYQDAR